jgi:2-polyprenyl-6-methoxyphenol hydroxylase-like FAD-dependent oxidoreductase
MEATPRLAIVGAGLGGLTLARVLNVHGFSAVVFESEVSPEARTQGGTLDIHAESGQLALHEARLDGEFRTHMRAEGEDLRIADRNGHVLVDKITPEDAPPNRPEIDRADLRQILLDSLPDDTVRWGRRLVRCRPLADERYELELEDGSMEVCDLLVGADGAHSRVRPLLTDVAPELTGDTLIELSIADVDCTHPEIAKMIGRGSFWVLADQRSLGTQRNAHGRVRVYLTLNAERDAVALRSIPFEDPPRARAALAEVLSGWSTDLIALLYACDGPVIPRPIKVLPIGLRWQPNPGVTLVGDAAHLMPPVGEGANQAMLDGAKLALAMVENPTSAFAAYEAEMFARTSAIARESAETAAMLQSPTAAQDMARFFGSG